MLPLHAHLCPHPVHPSIPSSFPIEYPLIYSLGIFGEQGFDEFMNVVLDDAEEVYTEKQGKEVKARRELGESCCPLSRASSRLSARASEGDVLLAVPA